MAWLTRRPLCVPNSSASWLKNKDSSRYGVGKHTAGSCGRIRRWWRTTPFESAGRDSWLLPNVAATGPVLDGQIEGPLWTSGRLPGKVALHFRGPDNGDKVVLPEPQRFNFTGPFSLAVWFRVARFTPDCVSSLIAKGGMTWRLERMGTTNCLTIDTTCGDLRQ